MPDATDLARIEEEMAPLQARLDEMGRQYDAVHEALHTAEMEAFDVAPVRARVVEALRRLPGVLDQLEEVLVVFDEGCSLVEAQPFAHHDDHWRRLREQCGLDALDGALEVVLGRLGRVVDRDVKEGDAERARDNLAAVVGRAR